MALHECIEQLIDLGTALNNLHQMTADIDENSAPLLVRNIREETLEVMGWHVSTLEAAQKVLAALERNNDLETARYSLRNCNQSFLEMFRRFYQNLFTANHIVDLERLERKKATKQWAQTTINDLYACQFTMQKVCAVLLGSWEMIAEILSGRALTVQSSSVGQQFLFPERK